MDELKTLRDYHSFCGGNLTETLSKAQVVLRGAVDIAPLLKQLNATEGALVQAGQLKHLSSQIDTAIHALGILRCLPHVLNRRERVIGVSLGADNAGLRFDLETDRRIAECTFINWRGGSETIRQNKLFKDFFYLAESDTQKKKWLYVLGKQYPLKFLQSNRALSSIMTSRKLNNDFDKLVVEDFRTVGEYFESRRGRVQIKDVSKYVSGLHSIHVSPGV